MLPHPCKMAHGSHDKRQLRVRHHPRAGEMTLTCHSSWAGKWASQTELLSLDLNVFELLFRYEDAQLLLTGYSYSRSTLSPDPSYISFRHVILDTKTGRVESEE